MRAFAVVAGRAACAAAVTAVIVSTAAAQPRRARPMRIVSTTPSITESLFALGLGDRVVGVSQFSRYPPQVTSLPKIGTEPGPSLERIVTLRPDLVVISDRLPSLGQRLDAARIPFVEVSNGSLASISSAMLRIGAAAGIESHARDVVAALQSRLDSLRQRPALTPRPKVLLIMGRTSESLTGMIAVGRDSYLNDLIDIAGGTNVLAASNAIPYPRVTLESVLSLNPDVIVDTVDMGATSADRELRQASSMALWTRFQMLSAVKSGRIRAAETDALFVPGPRVVDAAEWLAAVIRGERHP
jgi:iron complex transport system substrate-binding protein